MRYVILRDDDTNALTPIECLERLYRPFLDRGLPVNLAVIPSVATNTRTPDGRLEGYLFPPAEEEPADFLPATLSNVSHNAVPASALAVGTLAPPCQRPANDSRPIASNRALVSYLLNNPGYRIVQHGCRHDYLEFDCGSASEVGRRLDQGTKRLLEAGFPRPETFVAPYDRLSRASLLEVARRFRVLSSGWYEWRRLPYSWWPGYALKKLWAEPHWQVGRTLLLSHPGCLLSYTRSYSTMLETIVHQVEQSQLTVLVTHWWEYYRNQRTDDAFIDFLHRTADYLAGQRDIKVIAFSDLVYGRIPLN